MSVDQSPVAPPGAAEANPRPLPQPPKPSEEHRTRAVGFFERRTPIVYQNRNATCPLFSICNFLLLKGLISLPDTGKVSQEKLISIVSNFLTDTNIVTEGKDEEYARNLELNVDDAIALLPRLTTGIDMNPMFRNIDEFEFSVELGIFDLLGIPLYHGWIVDPKDTETATAIGSQSLHALVAGVTEFKSAHESQKGQGDLLEEAEVARVLMLSKDERGVNFDISQSHTSSTMVIPQIQGEGEEVAQGEEAQQADRIEENSNSMDDDAKKWHLIDNFLKSNPTQLTAHGLLCLRKNVKESELCVLYYDSHFNTMFKHNGMIYLLANDEGLIDKTDLVWQRLDEVSGAEVFVTSKFTLLKPETPRKQAQDYNAQLDNASEHACRLLTFDTSLVNDFIVNKKWEDLEDYLSSFVVAILKSTPYEVVMMHPELFLIPRMEKWLDMLSDENFQEADSFYQRLFELFRGCQGKYVASGIVRDIDFLGTLVKAKSKAAIRRSAEEIRVNILDYIHLHFPNAIEWAKAYHSGSHLRSLLLQSRRHISCLEVSDDVLGCLWDKAKDLRSYKLQSSKRKICLKVSEDLLNRLWAADETNYLQTLEEFQESFSKKRKLALNNTVASVSRENKIPSTAAGQIRQLPVLPASSGSRENKRPITSSSASNNSYGISDSAETPTSQIRQLPVLPAQMQSDKIYLLSDKLGKEVSAILDCLRQSHFVFPRDRLSITSNAGRLAKLCVHLKTCARSHASQPEPEELSKTLGLLGKASVDVFDCISAADILDEKIRLFLIDRATVVFELVLQCL